jgi:hypothetical protein
VSEQLKRQETEYTDLGCSLHGIAEAVKTYLDVQISQCEEPPGIIAVVEEDTLRITFENVNRTVRHGWDMQLLGFRDGYTARSFPSEADKKHVEVALSLFRQLVSGRNALRQMDVFPCNDGGHDEEPNCECFLGAMRRLGQGRRRKGLTHE